MLKHSISNVFIRITFRHEIEISFGASSGLNETMRGYVVIG